MTTIVVADDHKIVREGLVRLLEEREDFTVVGEASDGEEAVQMVLEKQPDVVIMDVAMPDLNGIDATRRITEAEPNAKVLALSMHSDGRYVRGMLQAGARGYILKDCAAEELTRAIRTVMSNQVYVSPGVTGTIVNDYVRQLSSTDIDEPAALTRREREVLQLLAEGSSTAQIASSSIIGVTAARTLTAISVRA